MEEARPPLAWPKELDFAKARKILFPNAVGDDDFPRMSESVRKTTRFSDEENPQGLDAFIHTLENPERKGSGLLSTAELAKKGISCPYFEARLGVLQAVRYAAMEKCRAPHAREAKSDLKALKKFCDIRFASIRKHLQNAIAAKREMNDRLRSYERAFFGAGHEWFSIDGLWRDIHDPIRSLETGLQKLSDSEEQNRHALDELIKHQYDPGQATRKAWAHVFAQYLGFIWFDLTGKKPTKKNRSPFIMFVSSAWNELTQDHLFSDLADEPSWNSVCREAVTSFEILQTKSKLLSWERSAQGFLPKYRFSKPEPSTSGQGEGDERAIVEEFTTDGDALSGKAPFDMALLFGWLSTVLPSKPDPEFLRLQKLLDAGNLSSADLTPEQVTLFSREKDRVAAAITQFPDPRALTPLELRRREIWRDEALAEWRRVAIDEQLPSSQTIAAGMNIKSALENWQGPAIRRFAKTLNDEAGRFGADLPAAQAAGAKTSESIFDDLDITLATRAEIENWLRPRTIFATRS